MTITANLVNELNPIDDSIVQMREEIDFSKPVQLADKRLVKIERLRLLSDPGFPFWDISYCYGRLKDGTPVLVRLPLAQLRKGKMATDIIEMCKMAGRYGKQLGIFDAISYVN